MDTLTAPPLRTPPPVRRRRSVGRVILYVVGGLFVTALLAVGVLYNRQIRSWLTHMVGPPEHTVPYEPIPASQQPDVRFAVAGDVGDGGDLEWRMAATMYVVGRTDPIDVLLLLGDNVYPDGDPALLDEYVFRPFAAVLDSGARLYAIVGNHDALADDGGLAELTELGMPGLWWSERIGDVLLVGLDSNQPDNPDQLAWLEATLAASDAPWKIVALHHPPYSSGYQGSNTDARDAFTPLFEHYGVQLVLSGHEHDYQRTVPINGVTYVVSGAGSGSRRTGTEDYTAYATSTVSFVELNVYGDHLLLRSVDHEMDIFDEFSIAR